MNGIIRCAVVEKIGDVPLSVFFSKPYILLSIRVATRLDLSNFYTEKVLRDYELAVGGYVNYSYDPSGINQPETRVFPAPTQIVDSFPLGTNIKYVFTFIEFN